MICPEYSTPQFLIFSSQVPKLLYYSHLPAIMTSLLIGFFVYFKSRHSLLSKLLLLISITFSLWVFVNLITWTNNDSNIIIFAWSFFGILYSLLYILCLYFAYVFIDKKDISLNKKALLAFFILPVIIFTPTIYNLKEFDINVCGIFTEGKYFTNYYYWFGFLIFLWIVILLVSRYRKTTNHDQKKQVLYLGIGMGLFLFFFFVASFLASLLVWIGLSSDFSPTQYGLFGMPVFLGFLAYLIVKYKVFNIKILAAQALVVALFILIASLIFVQNPSTLRIVIAITLLLVAIFGIMLIRSVKLEVQRKEELQIMSDKLAQANDQLRKLDMAKSDFISIASHQLRSPLTAVKGYISLIKEGSYGKIEPKVLDALSKVYASNERLIQLVEDLLSISRIESGRMDYKFVPIQVEGILQDTVDSYAITAKNKKLYLNFKSPEKPLPAVELDDEKIRQVFNNLVDNALKYTERGGVTVRAEIPNPKSQILNKLKIQNSKFEIPDDTDRVRITISDTGIGIPTDHLPYIFAKFSRGKDTDRLHATGTGLGLYVGKQLVEAHHGRVWAESDGEGKGTRFIIELPLSQKPYQE